MSLNIQPTLANEKVMLCPLQEKDFDDIYAVASDPKVWEQHPNKDRWKLEVFKVFFDGAMQSKGAFKIVNKADGKVIGCTRFYDHTENEILIGYTFYGTAYWGKGFNNAVKTLMLDYIFQFAKTVYFHVGADNIRSQIAIGRLGATKIAEEEVAYFGEQPKLNGVYRLTHEEWHPKVS
ncbi:RimJ/RimL family protein N-acetyltransferase [Pedobacter sp. UYEF25]